jgi:hypothetical protein
MRSQTELLPPEILYTQNEYIDSPNGQGRGSPGSQERKILDKKFYNLKTEDIPGAISNNLKYKDRGRKKRDFYPT